MARITIRPDLTGTVHMVATPAAPKLRDAETGEIATDRDGKTLLYTVQLLETYEGKAQLIKVTVPETGIDTALTPGVIVRPVNLIAAPWANLFAGQVQVGMAYRAESLAPLTPTSPTAPAAPKATVKAAASEAAA